MLKKFSDKSSSLSQNSFVEGGHSFFKYLLKAVKFPGKYLGQFRFPISCGTFKH